MKQQMQYVLVGYPFAGKTTLAKALEKQLGFARLSIDEVKFELGYENVSDDDVPDDAWENIFKEHDRRVTTYLKEGKTIINEYAWLTKEWRDRARKLAADEGVKTILIFVNTPEDIVRQRREENRKTSQRFDVPESVFEDAIRLFEKPGSDEEMILYTQNDTLDAWFKKNFQ